MQHHSGVDNLSCCINFYTRTFFKKFLVFRLIAAFSFPLSSYVQLWLISQLGFWPHPAQMTSPFFLNGTISTPTKTRAPSWSVISARLAPMSPSTALQLLWGNAAPVPKAPSHGERMEFSNAIAAGVLAQLALLRKRLAQPPRIESAHAHPIHSCQGMVLLCVSPTLCAPQARGWKSRAVRKRTWSVSSALRELFQIWNQVQHSAEITQTARFRGWCCSHQGLERKIISVDPFLQLHPLPPPPLQVAQDFYRNPLFLQSFQHPWLDLHKKVRDGNSV